jgi:hypothetical protein
LSYFQRAERPVPAAASHTAVAIQSQGLDFLVSTGAGDDNTYTT